MIWFKIGYNLKGKICIFYFFSCFSTYIYVNLPCFSALWFCSLQLVLKSWFFSFLYRWAFRCRYFTKFLQFLVKALRFTLFLRSHFYYFYHVPSILVFIVLPRTYVVPQTGCYSNFYEFYSLVFQTCWASLRKKNIGLFLIFVILLYLFLHFLRSFIHSLSRLVFITKLAPLSKEIWDVFGRFVFLL